MTIRDARSDDVGWIVHSWLHSFADSDAALLVTPRDAEHAERCNACAQWHVRSIGGRALAPRAYWIGQKALILALLRSSDVIVDEAIDNQLLDGFMCSSQRKSREGEPIVHYIYVRLSARGRGVAKALLSTLGKPPRILYTHRSRTLDGSRLGARFAYDPYQLYWSLAP